MHYLRFMVFISILLLTVTGSTVASSGPVKINGTAGTTLLSEKYAEFDEPWSMTFLPGGQMLVTEKSGTLLLVSADGLSKIPVGGIPKVAYGGQGGLGDVILHPDYAVNKLVYISYAEQGASGKRGGAVARGQLETDATGPKLNNVEVI